MASLAYQLMTLFHEEAVSSQDFERRFAFDTAESAVNNVHHGRPPQEWLPLVKSTLQELSLMEGTSVQEAVAYGDAILLLELLQADAGL